MEIKRVTKMDTTNFEVGDVFPMTLSDGEQVEAMAMKQESDGMIFMLIDCLLDESSMNSENTNRGGYDASDLRMKLNGEILERFPAEIREQMVAFQNGDLLRLPTEKEIFGENRYGEYESEDVTQFEPMKLRRNRIAFQGMNGAWEWWWLANKVRGSAARFASVNNGGDAYLLRQRFYRLRCSPRFQDQESLICAPLWGARERVIAPGDASGCLPALMEENAQ